MIEEVKDKSRRSWLGMKSRSNIGGSTAREKKKQEQESKDLLKASSKKSGKESRWFWKKSRSKEAKEGSNGNGPQVVENSETTNLETEDKPVQRTVQGVYRDDDGGPSPKILNTTVSAARDAVKEFAKDFVLQLKGNPNVCAALEAQMRQQLSMVTEAPPAPADLKFLAQAYIAFHLFSGFENASFNISNPGEKPWEVEQHMITCFEQYQSFKNKSQTVSKLLGNEPTDTFLSEYCLRKFKSIIPVDVESAIFGADCHHHTDLVNKTHPDTAFYRSFLGAAVSVWLLQRLRCSFEQKVVTISPTGGDDYQRRFMLPAVPGIGDNEDEESDRGLEILFTVFPGFRVSESIVKSLVYIVERPNPPPAEEETTTTPAEAETTTQAKVETTSLIEVETTSLPEVETTSPAEVETTSQAEVETATSVEKRTSSNVDDVAAEDQTPAAPASVQGEISPVEVAPPSSEPAPPLPLSTGGEGNTPPLKRPS